MEESTNGKLEEEVIVHGVEEFKPDGIIHVEVTPGDGHDSSSSSSSSSSSDEESPVLPVDEKEEFDSVEPLVVPLSQEFIPDGELVVEKMDVTDVTQLETTKEIKEQTLPSLDEDKGFVPAVLAAVSEETLEKFLSGSNGNIGESSDLVKLASVENVETKLQLDDENVENSSKAADLESKENVEKPADVPSVDTDKVGERSIEAEMTDSQINQPNISLAPRARHMTSWRSCCGLFDFLRRSDR